MGKILTTFEIGNILRTGITSEIMLLEENQTSENNEHNKQQAKNQLFPNDQSNSNNENKTKSENKGERLSKIPINIQILKILRELKKEQIKRKRKRHLVDKLKKYVQKLNLTMTAKRNL